VLGAAGAAGAAASFVGILIHPLEAVFPGPACQLDAMFREVEEVLGVSTQAPAALLPPNTRPVRNQNSELTFRCARAHVRGRRLRHSVRC
jgi:hypothetical protein